MQAPITVSFAHFTRYKLNFPGFNAPYRDY